MTASIADTIAVIVVTYNASATLDRCLSAIGRQTRRPDKVIVIDNGSTDGCVDGLENRYPWVHPIRLNRNVGFAAANNRAAEAAGEVTWLALLNPDAFPAPDWIEQLLAGTKRHPEATMFASRMLFDGDPDLLDGAGDALHVSGRPWRIGHGAPSATTGLAETKVFSPCAAAALYRADAFREVGGFDESFFCYLEDVDLGFRLRLVGGLCRYLPTASVAHVGSATTVRHSDFYLYHSHRNIVWNYVKNMPTPLFWRYLPLHLALNIGTMLLFAVRGRGGVVARAKLDALRGLSRVWQERHQVRRGGSSVHRSIRASLAGGWPWP